MSIAAIKRPPVFAESPHQRRCSKDERHLHQAGKKRIRHEQGAHDRVHFGGAKRQRMQCESEIGQIQTIDHHQQHDKRPWVVAEPHQPMLERTAKETRHRHVASVESRPALAQHECGPALPPLPMPAIIRWVDGTYHESIIRSLSPAWNSVCVKRYCFLVPQYRYLRTSRTFGRASGESPVRRRYSLRRMGAA